MKEITLSKANEGKQAIKATELKKPLVGTYRGTRTATGKLGPFSIHSIGDQEVYGTTDLNKKLELVSEGTEVSVQFTGKKQMSNGKSFNTFKVLVDE